MKNFIILIFVVIAGALGAYFLIPDSSTNIDLNNDQENTLGTIKNQGKEQPSEEQTPEGESIIGKSVEGQNITAYHYGEGETEILFIGGIHGGYEWNTALLAYETMDYLEANPDVIPENIKVTIIPVLNPDGLNKIVGSSSRFESSDAPTVLADTIEGRFNANEVDLNRNFDCDWKSTGTWQNKTVSGGSEVFSEPESQAIKNYVETQNPEAVVVWYSAAGGVYSSSCHNGISKETSTLTNIYANASGYKGYAEFDSYEITGDMVNWLAKKNIPAISVLLTNHSNTEWNKNKAGIEALLNHYAK
ncbi:hypothetical protein KKC45_01960 [Patescibacteria group bacterium]|nr:hypothetical protein [Patescibacteria group bacterium]